MEHGSWLACKKIRIVPADVVRIITSFLGWRALSMSITSTPSGPPLSAPPPHNLWPLAVERYHQMIYAGILTTDDQVELLDGCLVRKAPQYPQRCFVRQEMREWFDPVLPDGYHTMAQDPVTLPTSEPEPDNSVIRGQRRMFG